MNFYIVAGDEETDQVVLDKSSLTVEENNSATIVATVPAGKTVTWQSLDTSVATVTSGGVVTGQAAGQTQIIASFTDDNVTYSALCVVTVTGQQGEG